MFWIFKDLNFEFLCKKCPIRWWLIGFFKLHNFDFKTFFMWYFRLNSISKVIFRFHKKKLNTLHRKQSSAILCHNLESYLMWIRLWLVCYRFSKPIRDFIEGIQWIGKILQTETSRYTSENLISWCKHDSTRLIGKITF